MSTIINGFGALGVLLCIAMIALGILGRRVPVLGYVGVPLGVLVLGSLGTSAGAGGAATRFDSVDVMTLNEVANQGLVLALSTNADGRLVSAGVLLLAVWCAAIPAVVKSGKDWGWTIVDAVFAVILTVAGLVAVFMVGNAWGVADRVTPIATVLGVGGLGVVVASLRRGLFEDAERVAALRFAAGVAFLGAIGQIGHYVSVTTEADVLREALAASPEAVDTTMISGLEMLTRVTNVGWVAWAFGFLVALCGLFMELGEAVQKYMVIDGVAITAVAAAMLVSRGFERQALDDVRAVGNLQPMVEMLDEFGSELPAATIALNGALVDARPVEGGFGDVFVLEKQGEGEETAHVWMRKYAWSGMGWDADETNMEQAAIAPKPVLLVANGSMPAQALLAAAEKAPAGTMLLVRMGEVQKDVPMLARQRSGAFININLATEDSEAANQLWGRADKRGLYYGPVRWYGEGDEEKDLILKADSAFEQTESTGMTLLVNERAMIRQVVDYCLAANMTVQDESVVAREDVWCQLSAETFEDFRTKAQESWENAPNPKDLRYSAKVDARLPEGIGQLLENELDALAYCQQKAVDFGEEEGLSGAYKASFEVTRKGRIGWYEVDERAKLENRVLRKCIKQRIDTVVWPEHEAETDPDKEDDYTTIEYSVVFGDPPPPTENLEELLEEDGDEGSEE